MSNLTHPEPTTAAPRSPDLPSILDLPEDEMEAGILAMGQPAFRARQLWRALYHDCATSFDEMTTLSRAFRAELWDTYALEPLKPVLERRSSDRDVDKFVFALHDGEMIETVLMRYPADGHRRGRRTVCVSTQAGCALGCTFCATGQQGFVRDLSLGEIVGQVLHARRLVQAENEAVAARGEGKPREMPGVSNVVFMGMGEPFANYDNTLAAVRTLNHPQGVNLGARHMTISTVGLVPGIERLAREPYQVNLAVSLHAADDETRSRTMPVNRRYPIAPLMDACREYIRLTNRRIFFEYVLLEDQNDTPAHARRLASLVGGMLCHVNLIPVNPTAGGAHRRPDGRRATLFSDILKEEGIATTVRQEKGIDIDAGCGQLRARVTGTEPSAEA